LPGVFDNKNVVTASCGNLMSGVAVFSGSVYSWGKGEHEKSKEYDY